MKKIFLSVLSVSTIVSCSPCKVIPGLNQVGVCSNTSKEIKSQTNESKISPKVDNVNFNSDEIIVHGTNLQSIQTAELIKDETRINLNINQKESSIIRLGLSSNQSLLIGLWKLSLKKAQAESVSSTFYLSVQDNSITNAKIISLDASKITGTLSTLLIPDLSSQYSRTNHNHDTDYSPINHNHDSRYSLIGHHHDSEYAPLVHSHTAADVGAINSSSGVSDAGKVVKLNSQGQIDSSMLGVGSPALFDGSGNFYARMISAFPCFGTECQVNVNTTLMLADQTMYITQSKDFAYYGYHSFNGISSQSAIKIDYFLGSQNPRDWGVCLFKNTTCSGSCGFINRPSKNTLLYRYNSSGQTEWLKAQGNETGTLFDIVNSASYRRSNGTCGVITSNVGASASYTLYEVPSYSPSVSIPSTNLTLGFK